MALLLEYQPSGPERLHIESKMRKKVFIISWPILQNKNKNPLFVTIVRKKATFRKEEDTTAATLIDFADSAALQWNFIDFQF